MGVQLGVVLDAPAGIQVTCSSDTEVYETS